MVKQLDQNKRKGCNFYMPTPSVKAGFRQQLIRSCWMPAELDALVDSSSSPGPQLDEEVLRMKLPLLGTSCCPWADHNALIHCRILQFGCTHLVPHACGWSTGPLHLAEIWLMNRSAEGKCAQRWVWCSGRPGSLDSCLLPTEKTFLINFTGFNLWPSVLLTNVSMWK